MVLVLDPQPPVAFIVAVEGLGCHGVRESKERRVRPPLFPQRQIHLQAENEVMPACRCSTLSSFALALASSIAGSFRQVQRKLAPLKR